MSLEGDWIEILFERLCDIYGNRFADEISNPIRKVSLKTQWQNGLIKLTNPEVKRGLYMCRFYDQESIPSVIQFWHWSKGITYKKGNKYGK
jgi:hypothetical protein